MIVQISVVLSFALFGSTTAINYNFMDCPGNTDVWGILRRCCHSDQLPKGCECFDISRKSDFVNTGYFKPQCPGTQQVVFRIYTRYSVGNGEVIRAGKQNIDVTSLGSGKKTFFIAHGFTDFGGAPWMLDMKNALLNEGDFNVILVDWKNGAKPPNYYQAAANTRTVGAMIAKMIQDINFYKSVSFDNFHLIGHSLGAQIMGIAGKEIQRLTYQDIGRITGLDPAGPKFESFSANVRIDKSDALFVDIIHTDGEKLLSSGFGTRYSIGDVDFYPNGGQHQPSCPKETFGIFSLINFEAEKENGACSHGRAVDYFTDSIARCPHNFCTMGYHVNPNCRGDHYPKTGASDPFCCLNDV